MSIPLSQTDVIQNIAAKANATNDRVSANYFQMLNGIYGLAIDGSSHLIATTLGGRVFDVGAVGGGGGGGGGVSSVGVTAANGIVASVTNPTTTPTLALSLGAITPTSVTSSGLVSGSNLSGVNTGDQTSVTGNAGTATKLATARAINGVSFDGSANITVLAAWPATRTLTFSGDASGSMLVDGTTNASTALTLTATAVTPGSYTNANITVDAKGRVTSASNGSASGGVASVTGTAPIVSSGGSSPAISINNFTSSTSGAVPASGGGTTNFLRADGSWSPVSAAGGGTVTSVSVTSANGVSGVVANATSTPAITLTLGAITPSSVASTGTVTGTNLSGTNTGDQTSVSGNAGTATKLTNGRVLSITGDLSWVSPAFDGSADASAIGTLANTGVSAGSYLNGKIAIDSKGRVTAVSVAPSLIVGIFASGGRNSFQTVPGGSFTTVQISSTPTVDTAGKFNTSTYIYTIPEAGNYLLKGKIRFADNSQANATYGMGIDIANRDSANFVWSQYPPVASNGADTRQTILNDIEVALNSGDQVRMFVYCDVGSNTMNINGASLVIRRIS